MEPGQAWQIFDRCYIVLRPLVTVLYHEVFIFSIRQTTQKSPFRFVEF